MSKRAPRTANAVSLFPFLAVLICAMGALILLLLVTTRRIRQQQAHQAAAAVIEVQETEHPADNQLLGLPERLEDHPPVPVPTPVKTVPDPFDMPLVPLFAVELPPPPPDPNDAWRERLRVLQSEQTNLVSAVDVEQSVVADLRTSTSADERAINELEQHAAAIEREKQELEQEFQHLQQQQTDLDGRAAFLRRQIDESREQLASADSKFAIIPFDGRLGTTRRPIVIECTDQGLTFVSEGVTLRPSDLNGFTPRYNPLLAASRSLTKYWDRKDRRSSDGDSEGDPYVLLVVRPSGTIAYYVARSLLGPENDSFGYELVREDQEFVWPKSDPSAVKICRTIVERMLDERDALRNSVPESAQGRNGQFSDDTGDFRLDEVDQLRNPGRDVTINGQRFSRDPAGSAGPGPSRFSQERAGGGRTARDAPGTFYPPDSVRSVDTNQEDPWIVPDAGHGEGTEDLWSDRAVSITNDPAGTGSGFPPIQPRSPGQRSDSASRQGQAASPGEGTSKFGRSLRHSRSPFDDEPDASDERTPADSQLSRFNSSARSGSPDSAEASSAPVPPSMSPSGRGKSRTESTINSERPHWGIRSPGGTIGFEREVVIRVTAADVTIANETMFPISPNQPASELRHILALHLDHHIRSWGEPPRSFYWLPSVKFVVSQDGGQSYVRLRAIVDKWELRSTVESATE